VTGILGVISRDESCEPEYESEVSNRHRTMTDYDLYELSGGRLIASSRDSASTAFMTSVQRTEGNLDAVECLCDYENVFTSPSSYSSGRKMERLRLTRGAGSDVGETPQCGVRLMPPSDRTSMTQNCEAILTDRHLRRTYYSSLGPEKALAR